jgi:hypothetical protein
VTPSAFGSPAQTGASELRHQSYDAYRSTAKPIALPPPRQSAAMYSKIADGAATSNQSSVAGWPIREFWYFASAPREVEDDS